MHRPARRCYRIGKTLVITADTVARIDIEGRTMLRGNIEQRHTADRQNTVGIPDKSWGSGRGGHGLIVRAGQLSAGLAGISDGRYGSPRLPHAVRPPVATTKATSSRIRERVMMKLHGMSCLRGQTLSVPRQCGRAPRLGRCRQNLCAWQPPPRRTEPREPLP